MEERANSVWIWLWNVRSGGATLVGKFVYSVPQRRFVPTGAAPFPLVLGPKTPASTQERGPTRSIAVHPVAGRPGVGGPANNTNNLEQNQILQRERQILEHQQQQQARATEHEFTAQERARDREERREDREEARRAKQAFEALQAAHYQQTRDSEASRHNLEHLRLLAQQNADKERAAERQLIRNQQAQEARAARAMQNRAHELEKERLRLSALQEERRINLQESKDKAEQIFREQKARHDERMEELRSQREQAHMEHQTAQERERTARELKLKEDSAAIENLKTQRRAAELEQRGRLDLQIKELELQMIVTKAEWTRRLAEEEHKYKVEQRSREDRENAQRREFDLARQAHAEAMDKARLAAHEAEIKAGQAARTFELETTRLVHADTKAHREEVLKLEKAKAEDESQRAHNALVARQFEAQTREYYDAQKAIIANNYDLAKLQVQQAEQAADRQLKMVQLTSDRELAIEKLRQDSARLEEEREENIRKKQRHLDELTLSRAEKAQQHAAQIEERAERARQHALQLASDEAREQARLKEVAEDRRQRAQQAQDEAAWRQEQQRLTSEIAAEKIRLTKQQQSLQTSIAEKEADFRARELKIKEEAEASQKLLAGRMASIQEHDQTLRHRAQVQNELAQDYRRQMDATLLKSSETEARANREAAQRLAELQTETQKVLASEQRSHQSSMASAQMTHQERLASTTLEHQAEQQRGLLAHNAKIAEADRVARLGSETEKLRAQAEAKRLEVQNKITSLMSEALASRDNSMIRLLGEYNDRLAEFESTFGDDVDELPDHLSQDALKDQLQHIHTLNGERLDFLREQLDQLNGMFPPPTHPQEPQAPRAEPALEEQPEPPTPQVNQLPEVVERPTSLPPQHLQASDHVVAHLEQPPTAQPTQLGAQARPHALQVVPLFESQPQSSAPLTVPPSSSYQPLTYPPPPLAGGPSSSGNVININVGPEAASRRQRSSHPADRRIIDPRVQTRQIRTGRDDRNETNRMRFHRASDVEQRRTANRDQILQRPIGETEQQLEEEEEPIEEVEEEEM